MPPQAALNLPAGGMTATRYRHISSFVEAGERMHDSG
jgi:hypothetical protein